VVVVVAVVAALALASVVRQLRYQRQRLVTRLGLLHQGGRRLSAACHHRQQGRTHAAERNGIIDVGLRCLVRKLIRQLQLDRLRPTATRRLRLLQHIRHISCNHNYHHHRPQNLGWSRRSMPTHPRTRRMLSTHRVSLCVGGLAQHLPFAADLLQLPQHQQQDRPDASMQSPDVSAEIVAADGASRVGRLCCSRRYWRLVA
jgi:hypothetical protein